MNFIDKILRKAFSRRIIAQKLLIFVFHPRTELAFYDRTSNQNKKKLFNLGKRRLRKKARKGEVKKTKLLG
jgi:hypothetical protein